ncbi:hypothetical protein BKA56DRAFT_668636 [Ilyonectria sp. MPI-CAGE-AT-0026]|nr:hypothetical protein BKA56DRAFT_668636 [Ilyonectria sp. MPI-CAGE-AT-0026]
MTGCQSYVKTIIPEVERFRGKHRIPGALAQPEEHLVDGVDRFGLHNAANVTQTTKRLWPTTPLSSVEPDEFDQGAILELADGLRSGAVNNIVPQEHHSPSFVVPFCLTFKGKFSTTQAWGEAIMATLNVTKMSGCPILPAPSSAIDLRDAACGSIIVLEQG